MMSETFRAPIDVRFETRIPFPEYGIRLTRGEQTMRFRKRPVEVEAFQWTPEHRDPRSWPRWLVDAYEGDEASTPFLPDGGSDGSAVICTLEGDHVCRVGDWIIRGIRGELYPCDPDIFEATYVPASDDIGETSDGYHTFNELYRHRHGLVLALMATTGGWAARNHHDGSKFDGYFIVGLNLGKQITYHLPDELWAIVEDLGCVVPQAPPWDRHTSDEAVLRLMEYVLRDISGAAAEGRLPSREPPTEEKDLMSFSFKSHAETGASVFGHNETKDGNPAGGFACSPEMMKNRPASLSPMLDDPEYPVHLAIRWQDGPVNRLAGEEPNGAFVEDVIDVCKRRLEFYQDSPFACEENAAAVDALDEALGYLLSRRKDRAERGVQGKHEA